MRRALQSIAAAAAFTAMAACGDPSDKELQQARSAIESARSAGADLYAKEEFSEAEAALKNATEAVDQRDYRLALNRALSGLSASPLGQWLGAQYVVKAAKP